MRQDRDGRRRVRTSRRRGRWRARARSWHGRGRTCGWGWRRCPGIPLPVLPVDRGGAYGGIQHELGEKRQPSLPLRQLVDVSCRRQGLGLLACEVSVGRQRGRVHRVLHRVEDSPDHGVGRLESLVVVFVLGYVEAGAQLRADAEVQDVRDPFQDDLAAGVLGAEVEADQEVSEVQGAVSASREVDELFQQGDELAVVDFLDRCWCQPGMNGGPCGRSGSGWRTPFPSTCSAVCFPDPMAGT